MKEAQFTTFDGAALFYRAWGADSSPTRAIVIFHRGHEHSGRMTHLAESLATPGCAVFAWDQRGHGRSPGERGYADDFSDLARDAESFIRHIQSEYDIDEENLAVVAHSVAAVFIAQWVHDYAPRIRALVLATPALQVKLYVPLALPGLRALTWWSKLRGKPTPFITSYVKGKLLTHDAAEAAAYDSDSLISKQIAVNILLGLHSSAARIVPDAGAIVTPTLLLSARADWVVRNAPQRKLFNGISSDRKRVEVYKGMYHSIFHEKDRALPIAAVREFIDDAFNRPVDRTFLIEADQRGFTHEEYQWLKAGLPMISVRRLGYRLVRTMMRTVGSLSEGVRIGWRTGFDSGESLDHVYRNTPAGTTPLGRMIDNNYLSSVGWKGIRQRKINLEQLLARAITRTAERAPGSGIEIVDVAGGPGRYVLDAMRTHASKPITALIRDWSESGLEHGRAIAAELGVSNARYERADAFSAESYGALEGRTDIGIISGLFELFPENSKIRTALAGMARAVKPGGYLIYTNQPWHPQIEFIAEVLWNRDKQPWIMRRRTQAEMDELVREAGFEKEGQLVDNWGIFTVSIAKRSP